MATDSVKEKAPASIDAPITYIVDTGEKPVSTSHGPGARLRHRTGKFETHTMKILNGRLLDDPPRLERDGFCLVDHDNKVTNFHDTDEIEQTYYREMEELIKAVSGAVEVMVFDHTVRSGDEKEQEEKLLREPVKIAHNDYTEWSGPERLRNFLGKEEAEKKLKKRMAIIQVWRAINKPIQSHPLAICDARSVTFEDFLAAERRHPDRVGEIYQLMYSPDHNWVYFPEMRRDEALVFKVYDSKKDGRARFTAHGSFDDPTSPSDAPPRESIEIRAFAFFDEDA